MTRCSYSASLFFLLINWLRIPFCKLHCKIISQHLHKIHRLLFLHSAKCYITILLQKVTGRKCTNDKKNNQQEHNIIRVCRHTYYTTNIHSHSTIMSWSPGSDNSLLTMLTAYIRKNNHLALFSYIFRYLLNRLSVDILFLNWLNTGGNTIIVTKSHFDLD